MPIDFPIADLPRDLNLDDAVEAAYGVDLDWIADKLRRQVSVLVECDKQVVTYLYAAIRGRLRDPDSGTTTLRCRFVSGQPRRQEGQDAPQPQMASLMQLMIREITDHVRSAEPGTVIVIPHLDLLTTTTRSGLSVEAKEVIALIYENPEVLLLAFKDPEFELPKTIEGVFPAKRQIIGVERRLLTRVILQREARKFGVEHFDPFSLYKYVSGLNVVRLREVVQQFSDRMDYDPRAPEARQRIFHEIRELTRGGELEVPKIDLDKDIGGYKSVKEKIKKDILVLLKACDALKTEEEVKAVEELIPRGMIFEGPPGTGKTFFAKAIATAIDATVHVVAGPELKSKWVGESEANLRNIFTRARRSAPAIIIFDELDSFAHRRGSYSGSGVEHSMVNQLLTEMDGFRKDELVFVIGTTNFVEALDEALLRPGRFELKIRIPYPKEADRREILTIYREKFALDLSDEVFEHMVRKTSGYVNAQRLIKFSGDHLYALCRGLAREQVRRGAFKAVAALQNTAEGGEAEGEAPKPLEIKDVDAVIGETFELSTPTEAERKVIATHECGHAMLAALTPAAKRPNKVTIEGEDEEISNYYTRMDPGSEVETREEGLADVATSLGGRAAEQVVFGKISGGAASDLFRATRKVREMLEMWGMGANMEFVYEPTDQGWVRRRLSESREADLDQEVKELLDTEYKDAVKLLQEHKAELVALADLLLEKQTLERKDLMDFFKAQGFTVDWGDRLKVKDKDGKLIETVESKGSAAGNEDPRG